MFVNVNAKAQSNFSAQVGRHIKFTEAKGKKPRRDVQAKAKSLRDLQA